MDIDKMLTDADFSKGRKDRVWQKIKQRMDDELSLEELDEAAGGISDVSDDSNKKKGSSTNK